MKKEQTAFSYSALLPRETFPKLPPRVDGREGYATRRTSWGDEREISAST